MKELSIEEKAKRYDEAIEKARQLCAYPTTKPFISDLQDIFPELKESEDENIKKALIIYHSSTGSTHVLDKFTSKQICDWLEKQGRQKPLYIRFGDVPSNETSKIYRGEVEIGEENGVSVYPAFEVNGDIVLGLTLPITKTTLYTQQHLLEYDNRPCYLVSGDYVGKGTDGEPLIRNITIIKRLDNYRIKNFEKQGEQKSLDDIAKEVTKDKDAAISFLKSTGIINENGELADEYKIEQGEQNPAWSEEDENYKDALIGLINEIKSQPLKRLEDWDSYLNWLKSLKDRVQPQPKWSKEDEKIYQSIMDDTVQENQLDDKQTNWLKSLRPQNTWKPSDEQMKALEIAIRRGIKLGTWEEEALKSLKEQLFKLKKLRKE